MRIFQPIADGPTDWCGLIGHLGFICIFSPIAASVGFFLCSILNLIYLHNSANSRRAHQSGTSYWTTWNCLFSANRMQLLGYIPTVQYCFLGDISANMQAAPQIMHIYIRKIYDLNQWHTYTLNSSCLSFSWNLNSYILHVL